MFPVRPLGSTGVTPLLRYYGPLRHPLGHSRLCIPATRWLCASQEGLPGSSTDLSTRAAPNRPGRPAGCLPVASPPVSGFILVGGLATFVFLSRPNRVHLRYGSRVCPSNASPDGFLHPALVRLHVRTGNLHGELLSVHKISQAYPGVPTVRERPSSSAKRSCAAMACPCCMAAVHAFLHNRGSDMGTLLLTERIIYAR